MEYKDVKTPQELLEFMDIIEYGYLANGNKYNYKDEDAFEAHIDEWRLSSPQQLLENKIGHCFDQVELERDWFAKNNYKFKAYFIFFYNCDDKTYSNHTFLIYEDNNKYYYFEHSWGDMKGIYEFDSLSETFNYVALKNLQADKPLVEDIKKLTIIEYGKPEYNVDYETFTANILKNGREIDISEAKNKYQHEVLIDNNELENLNRKTKDQINYSNIILAIILILLVFIIIGIIVYIFRNKSII